MKKYLFLATTNLNMKDGGALAQKAYLESIRILSNNNVDVVMPEECCYNEYSNSIRAPKRPFLKSLISGSIHRYKSFLQQYLDERRDVYDICIINGGIYAGDMMDLIHSFDIKIVVIHHNYEPEYQMDNKTSWTFYGLTPFFIKRNEKNSYLKADVNCFLTNADRRLFEINYGIIDTPSFVIGCYEYDYITDGERQETLSVNGISTLAITGSMNTVQTINGIRDFRTNYFEIFNSVCPDWKIVIAGRNPSKEIYDFSELDKNRIKVIPNPDNIQDIISSASIFFCPTNSGGGIKLRLMDGLKAGKPVLVHKVSARGYDSLYDEPFFKIYDDKASFENGLQELVCYVNRNNNPKDIRQRYSDYFSFDSGTRRLHTVFNLLQDI